MTAQDEGIWVTVCDKCLCASCWQGEFYCSEYRTAGTVEKHISELRARKLESAHYWLPTEGPTR